MVSLLIDFCYINIEKLLLKQLQGLSIYSFLPVWKYGLPKYRKVTSMNNTNGNNVSKVDFCAVFTVGVWTFNGWDTTICENILTYVHVFVFSNKETTVDSLNEIFSHSLLTIFVSLDESQVSSQRIIQLKFLLGGKKILTFTVKSYDVRERHIKRIKAR